MVGLHLNFVIILRWLLWEHHDTRIVKQAMQTISANELLYLRCSSPNTRKVLQVAVYMCHLAPVLNGVLDGRNSSFSSFRGSV